jgi:hypothetical protein
MKNEENRSTYCTHDDNWYGMLFAVVLGAAMAMAFDSWGVGIGVGWRWAPGSDGPAVPTGRSEVVADLEGGAYTTSV